MQTKTNKEPRIVYRFFNAENGNCITEAEARKLPRNVVIAEAIRIPAKNSPAQKVQKQSWQRYPSPMSKQKEVNQPVPVPVPLQSIAARFLNRLKRAFIIFRDDKKEQPLLEVEVNRSFR
ncbi:MAG: hypothetical protein KF746_25165 [Chitinophagaceae bacterium]|nr:hypothetical protein [Chitinophagaceae bacterium]